MQNLKWYVLNENFNARKIELFNIFNHSGLTESLEKILKKYTNFEDFKEKLKNKLFYYFNSKREYEILVKDLGKTIEEKISVYDQVIPNVDLLANYIIDEYNKNKRKKLEK